MARDDQFEYEVALSFAGPDRAVAEEFAALLKARDIQVFYDEYQSAELWGKDLVVHLVNLYSRKARYGVLFISRSYPIKAWTEAERRRAQELSLRDADEYILLLGLDDTDVPGMTKATGYRDLRQHSLESVADWLAQKLSQTKGQSGPPSQSHDLRSGNVL